MNTTNFAAKIMAQVRTSTCIDTVDADILTGLLQDALHGIADYYEEEFSNAIASVRSSAYDAGYSDGYDDGQSDAS